MASGDHQDTVPKPSGKRTKKLSEKEQSERFKEAAREIGADEGGQAFKEAICRLLLSRGSRHE